MGSVRKRMSDLDARQGQGYWTFFIKDPATCQDSPVMMPAWGIDPTGGALDIFGQVPS
jgi:hypothetical protein